MTIVMTTPELAFNIRGRGRHYPYPPVDPSEWPRNRWDSIDPGDVPEGITALPSVTNVISVNNKPGLLGWAAECAIREMYAEGSFPKDVEAAVRAHKYASNRARDKRADAGTRAHTLAERLTSDLPLPASISEEDEAYADAYMKFWADREPVPVYVEATVYGAVYGGTADLIAEIDGSVGVVDYKSKGSPPDADKRRRYGLLFDETRLQLAALARAPHVALADGDGWRLEPMPAVEWAMGVVLYPDGSFDSEELGAAELDRWYGGFLGAVELWRASKEMAA